jgi:hypothetical protein
VQQSGRQAAVDDQTPELGLGRELLIEMQGVEISRNLCILPDVVRIDRHAPGGCLADL